jgi:hypothetical protein
MKQLQDYINDPNNDLNNFNLGLFYEQINHYSPASSYYLRCAEKTNNLDLRYESLLRMYFCFKAFGNRDHTCDSILKQAISICPSKPEAYYLLTQYYESKSDWLNVYAYSCIGMDLCANQSKFIVDINFPGTHGFLFQKAASSWWVGKPKQCRQLYQTILNEHINELSDYHKSLLENNLSRLGSGPESQAIRPYRKNLKNKLRISFDLVDIVENNYSQVYQDIFVLAALNGKKEGTYLEIGSAEPFKNNNTALLEKNFYWRGVGIEFNENFVKQYKENRSNPILCIDALIIDYNKLLNKYFPDTDTIDYLQLDIEPPRNTFQALLSIPFDKYKFSVITYEHDYYVDISKSYRSKSREYLNSLGYKLIVPNISPDESSPFEDWWVHPDLISAERIQQLECIDKEKINQAEVYFLTRN